jgi:hypothetical protein
MSKVEGRMRGWPPYTVYFCDQCKKEIKCDRYDPPISIGGEHYCDKCFKELVRGGELRITRVVSGEDSKEDFSMSGLDRV